jgi:hypothetical protein
MYCALEAELPFFFTSGPSSNIQQYHKITYIYGWPWGWDFCTLNQEIWTEILQLSILLHYFIYNNTTSVTVQPRQLICIFSFFLSSQHVLALAGHHQVLPFMLKLLNCIAYLFCLVLLSTKLCYSLIIFIKIFVLKLCL